MAFSNIYEKNQSLCVCSLDKSIIFYQFTLQLYCSTVVNIHLLQNSAKNTLYFRNSPGNASISFSTTCNNLDKCIIFNRFTPNNAIHTFQDPTRNAKLPFKPPRRHIISLYHLSYVIFIQSCFFIHLKKKKNCTRNKYIQIDRYINVWPIF